MIGKKKSQHTLFDAGNVFDVALDMKSFHGQLAVVSDRLFKDEDFAALYSDSLGRPSVPPSQLALVVLMQGYGNLSDQAAIDATAYDLRWAVVLRREAGRPLCAKSTLQLFRAHLVLHNGFLALIQASLDEARRSGLLKSSRLVAAVDTKPLVGRGAVEDTYNLLGTASRQLATMMARHRGQTLEAFAREHGFEYLTGTSTKGAADIDWSDPEAREAFLARQVGVARKMFAMFDRDCPEETTAAELLGELLLQDVHESCDQDGKPTARLKHGTTPGRIPSATDPDQRHGHKSQSKKFVGAKSSVATDCESGLVLGVDVLPGDAADATRVLELIEQAEMNSGVAIEVTLGDCAYGSGATRQEFADAGRELVARVPAAAATGLYPKSEFSITLPPPGTPLEETIVLCPGGQQGQKSGRDGAGNVTFTFAPHCDSCALRSLCTTSKHGRTLRVHAQEALLQKARAFQATSDGRVLLRRRLAVENSLARLARHGIGQARYIGHLKTRYQLSVTAAVVNLRRCWNWAAAQTAETTGNGVPAMA